MPGGGGYMSGGGGRGYVLEPSIQGPGIPLNLSPDNPTPSPFTSDKSLQMGNMCTHHCTTLHLNLSRLI